MTDAESSGDDLGLAVWDAIAEILHRRIHDLPEPARDELQHAADALSDSANAFLSSEKAPWPLYPFAREMALAVLDWWNSPTDNHFAALQQASRSFAATQQAL